jgi:hypothetical protein
VSPKCQEYEHGFTGQVDGLPSSVTASLTRGAAGLHVQSATGEAPGSGTTVAERVSVVPGAPASGGAVSVQTRTVRRRARREMTTRLGQAAAYHRRTTSIRQ